MSLLDDALANAARTWEHMLSELHPEHTWVVTVGQFDDAERERRAAAMMPATGDARAGDDHPNSRLDRHDTPAARPSDEHGLDEAA